MHGFVIVPVVLLVSTTDWFRGDYSRIVSWMKTMHARGAMLCLACSADVSRHRITA